MRALRVVLLAALFATIAAGAAPKAEAQQSPVTATLVEFPSFLGPEGILRIGLNAANSGSQSLSNLRVQITIYEGVSNRSSLERTFAGRLGQRIGSDTFPVEGAIEPRKSRAITVEKPLSEISFFRPGAQDRAHPVRIALFSGQSQVAAINTHMIYFSRPPDRPLELALVVAMHHPSIYRRGRTPSLVTSQSLSTAIDGGRLDDALTALEKHPDVPVTIAPTGLLVDMLADLADGFPRLTSDGGVEQVEDSHPLAVKADEFLDRVRTFVKQRSNVRTMVTPYSAALLPALVSNDLADRAQNQIGVGKQRITDGLGASPLERWLLPVHGPLDQRTISQIRRTEVDRFILDPRTVSERRGPGLTTGLPVRLPTVSGEVTALLSDTGLTERLARRDSQVGPIQSRQRLLADTATIMLEAPARRRAVVALTPLTWSISETVAASMVDALEDAPWLKLTTPDAIVSSLGDESVRMEFAPAGQRTADGPGTPPEEYFSDIVAGREAVDEYAVLDPPLSRVTALEQRLLIAESADWWSSRSAQEQGRAFARAIRPAVQEEFRKIDAPKRQAITLTSREGVIPLIIGSRLDYEINVVIRLESDKLQFPEGAEKRHRLKPRQQTIEIPTIARATGTFPVEVRVETPDGVAMASSKLDVRSTAFNIVAVAITGGAGLFLVAWWTAGIARRKLP